MIDSLVTDGVERRFLGAAIDLGIRVIEVQFATCPASDRWWVDITHVTATIPPSRAPSEALWHDGWRMCFLLGGWSADFSTGHSSGITITAARPDSNQPSQHP